MQKRFDSFVYKQLRHSKPKSGEDQAFAVTGGGKNRPGRDGSRHGSRKPGGSQGGRGNGDSGGRGSSGGGASSGSIGTATAKPGGRTCLVCKSDQHYVRDYPKQICQEEQVATESSKMLVPWSSPELPPVTQCAFCANLTEL